LGRELLEACGGTAFSWQHKGSSYYFPQDTKPVNGNETGWDIEKRQEKYKADKWELDLKNNYRVRFKLTDFLKIK
jgi:hypothetical protein